MRPENWKIWHGSITSAKYFRCFDKPRPAHKKKSNHVKDQNGNVLTTKVECMNHWSKNFQWLLNQPPTPAAKDLYDAATIITVPNNDTDSIALMVTAAKAGPGMGSLKNSHAPGISSITADLLKTGREHCTQWLTHINYVWVYKVVPDGWRCRIILSFLKCKGDKLICSNHRRHYAPIYTGQALHQHSSQQGPTCHP